MSDSLKNLIELNHEKQTSLERRYSVLKGDIRKRAIRWIARKNPDKAGLLVGVTDVDLVIKDLALAYKREPWSSSENDTVINSILYPEHTSPFCNDVYPLIILYSWVLLTLAISYYFDKQIPSLGFVIVSILKVLWLITTLYPITLIVRYLQKILVVRFNLDLAWYAPISFFFKTEEEYNKERRLLLIEEENIEMALQQEKAQNFLDIEKERMRIEKDYEKEFDKKLDRK